MTEVVISLTTQIVSAHVANNPVQATDLPDLIRSVYSSLKNAGAAAPTEPERPEPAVPIRKSVCEDFIVCLEDGKKLKMLKRHLSASYGLTPDQYRERWNLPHNYPMVAPSYARKRSELAVQIGLGRKAPPLPQRGRRKGA
jgi:predicted transcriptional regulator